jgi:hypothetical protein
LGKRQPPSKPKPKAEKPQPKQKETKAEIRARIVAAFKASFAHEDR